MMEIVAKINLIDGYESSGTTGLSEAGSSMQNVQKINWNDVFNNRDPQVLMVALRPGIGFSRLEF